MAPGIPDHQILVEMDDTLDATHTLRSVSISHH